jgi:hypothetical protein
MEKTKPYIITGLLCTGAILTSVFSSMYDEKKDNKMIVGIVIGVIMYAGGLLWTNMITRLGSILIAIGSILVGLCSYFYSKALKNTGTSGSKKRGLQIGIGIGITLLIYGIIITVISVSFPVSQQQMVENLSPPPQQMVENLSPPPQQMVENLSPPPPVSQQKIM